MSLALHGHHLLLIATLIFLAAILTPHWYRDEDKSINANIFQVCTNSSSTSPHYCQWVFSFQLNSSLFETIKITNLILIASCAIACIGMSSISLLFGSWYIQQHKSENSSKWLLVLTIIATTLSFLLSCAVWALMLTTNSQQKTFTTAGIRSEDLGYSFWISIGSSGVYLYALLIYFVAMCKY